MGNGTEEKRLLRGYLFFYMSGELDEQGSAHEPEAWRLVPREPQASLMGSCPQRGPHKHLDSRRNWKPPGPDNGRGRG